MNQRTKTGLEILQVAAVLGLLGDVLLRQTPWGLNVLLFNLAFAAGMIVLIRRHAANYLTAQTLALFGAMVFFASMFVWRDSIELRVADTGAIVVILSVLFIQKMNVTTRLAGLFHYVVAFLWSSLNAFFAPLLLVGSDVKWSEMPRDGWRKHTLSAIRGVAIATPLILIFGALFVAADAAYEGLVQRAFNIRFEVVFSHVLIFSAFAWLSAGYLRGVVIRPIGRVEETASVERSIEARDPSDAESKVDSFRAESGEHPVTLPENRSVVDHLNTSDPPDTDAAEPASVPKEEKSTWQWATIDNSITSFTLGSVEVGVVLGLMNLLFLSFVIVQVPYLFGGMDLVQTTPDFKLAEYARRGFGELVAVSALVLPTLLIGHWLIKKEARAAQNLFRVLAGTQIVLLFIIMTSAVQRLVLLTGNLGYGMTTVRLYPLIFMSWLAVVFVWFAATVLRGTRQYFAIGALWSAFFFLAATHLLNPDAFIVKANLALMRQGRAFDGNYNSLELSSDALPALVEALPSMNELDQIAVTQGIVFRHCEEMKESDWRSWNIDRRAARKVVEQNPALAELLGGCDTAFIRRLSE